jgi:hypothetical protein
VKGKKVSIYLPSELAVAVEASSIPVSEICQDALREALPDDDEDRVVTTLRRVKKAVRDHERALAGG